MSTAVPCSVGTHAAGDRMSCPLCPAGFKCPIAQLASPIACTNATYQNETGQSVCLDCPAAYSCLNTAETPVKCSSQEYSPVAVTVCITCSPGHRYVSYMCILCLFAYCVSMLRCV